MFPRNCSPKKALKITVSLIFVLFLGIFTGYLTNHVLSENARFESFAESIFKKEVSQNSLTLHYSLALPEKQGISAAAPSLGTVSSDRSEALSQCQEYETILEKRYLCFQPWEQIAVDMKRNVRHLYRLHDEALELITVPAA